MWLQHIWTSQGEVQSACESGAIGFVTRRGTSDAHFADEGSGLLLLWVWCLAHFHSSVWLYTSHKAKNNKDTRDRFQPGLKPPKQNAQPLLPNNILFSKAAALHDITDSNETGRICGMIFMVRLAEKYVYVVVSSGHHLQILQSTALPLARLGKATGGKHMTLKEEWPTAVLTLGMLECAASKLSHILQCKTLFFCRARCPDSVNQLPSAAITGLCQLASAVGLAVGPFSPEAKQHP